LNEIDAGNVRELIVINKADIADPAKVAELLRIEPHAFVVSAKTGEGINELLLAIEQDLPRLLRDVDVVIPYQRGDLISRAHSQGDVLTVEHIEAGTHITARVPERLATELQQAAND
jgi:GTP-binding protein HflX